MSSLSEYDYVSLIGHYQAIQHKPAVDEAIYGRGYSKEALAQLKAQTETRQSKTKVQSLNLILTGDLGRFDYPHFGYALTLYNAYHENGVLPFQGPLADQPAQTIEIFNTLDALRSEEEARLHKETQRQSKREANVKR